MECDIHAFIEVKENEEWHYHDWRAKYKTGTYSDGSPQYNYDNYFDDPFYIGRNYDLFAILANVRNGRGFAGILTGTGFKPISQPRGLPDDITEQVYVERQQWGIDGHSDSWVSLAELLAFDWNGQTTTQYAVVNQEEYAAFKQKGKPNSWDADVSGRTLRKISNAEMDQILAGESELPDTFSYYYTTIAWQETYREAVGDHWFKVLDELAKLGKPEDVRLVFWFDN